MAGPRSPLALSPRGASESRSRAGRDRRRAPTETRSSAAAPSADRQWRFQGQLLELGRPDLVAGPQRHLDEGGAGQQHRVEGGVVGQPGVRVERDAAAEGKPLALGVLDRRPEQRMIGLRQGRPRRGRRRRLEALSQKRLRWKG